MNENTKKMFKEIGMAINPKIRVQRLGIAQQQLVEIVKAISKNAKLIIMDEPSAPLTEQETETLHTIVRQLKGKESLSFIFPTEWRKSLKYVIEYQFFGMGNIYLLIRFLRPAVRP